MNTEKEKRAIEYLKAFEPKDEPYYLCYSGGKDSDAIRILAKLAGVRHECKHNLTTVDAPETVRYVREMIGRESIEMPKMSMWELIVKKRMPPTRIARYCCQYLKERGGKGRIKITGVRWSESAGRAKRSGLVNIMGKPKTMARIADEDGLNYQQVNSNSLVLNDDNSDTRRFVERCYRTTSTLVNPIVDWTDEDVWEFLAHYGCKGNPLYYCGESRIGCIGCPLSGTDGMKRDFVRYPKYRENYVRAFDRMLKAREESGLKNPAKWKSGESVMRWWLQDNPEDQIEIDFGEEIDDD